MARAPATLEIEALPEADRLEGCPHPRETVRLYGHGRAEAEVAGQFASARLHHALLITGREGIGKATLAYAIARYALADPGERGIRGDGPLAVPPLSIAGRQVRALSHPGLLVIRRPWQVKEKRFSASIPVDEVRRLRSFLAHAASAGAWRVVIVDQADELNIPAANALLKSLEEPPPRALFLIVSSEPGRLLTTIRSRCRRLDLAPLASADLRAAASAAIAAGGGEPPGEAQWPAIERIAQGSARRLITLARADGTRLAEAAAGLFALLPKVDWPQVHALADSLTAPGAEPRFEQFFDLYLDLLARLVRARASGQGHAEDVRLAARAIPEDGLASWAELWETVVARKAEALALNLDRRSLIIDLVARMQSAAGA